MHCNLPALIRLSQTHPTHNGCTLHMLRGGFVVPYKPSSLDNRRPQYHSRDEHDAFVCLRRKPSRSIYVCDNEYSARRCGSGCSLCLYGESYSPAMRVHVDSNEYFPKSNLGDCIIIWRVYAFWRGRSEKLVILIAWASMIGSLRMWTHGWHTYNSESELP